MVGTVSLEPEKRARGRLEPAPLEQPGPALGDSGGPLISEDGYIVAVNSFVLNSDCNGAGFGYRVDTQLANDFDFG